MYGNDASNYAIDTNTLIDTSLDGIADNDSDNKDSPSYTDGSPFILYNLGSDNKREHKIQLALIKNGVVTTTKIITVILDYISATVENDINLSGSGTTELSSGDRKKLEELSKMIRDLTGSDRIILMQRYNTLVENWNNPFDKAKSLIDIQEGIESSSMDSEKKAKISKIVDELLIGDAQVTDEVGIAALLIKDLIPAESPHHDALLSKLAEIQSHPALLDANKKLGKEMLVLIENDTTIPDKYKWHIKNQLLVIINGGASSVPSETTAPWVPTVSGESGILGFIAGFVKIFFIIIGIILLIGIIAFIFYRITRKGTTIGFQDFLIDSVFHNEKAPPISESITKSNAIVNGPPPLPKEDPLSSYTPIITPPVTSPVVPISVTHESMAVSETNPISDSNPRIDSTPTLENIPDWLKAPIAQHSMNPVVTHDILPVENITTIPENIASPEIATPPQKTPVVIPKIPTEAPVSPRIEAPETDTSIPDWIKGTSLGKDEIPSSTWEPVTPIISSSAEVPPSFEEESLPDWLINSLQAETTASVETKEITNTENPFANLVWETLQEETNLPLETPKKLPKKGKTVLPKKENWVPPSDTKNIPDWLK